MPRYIKSVSFKAGREDFNSEKDDAVANDMLQRLRDGGA